MKKLWLLLLTFLAFTGMALAQQKADTPAYLKNPTLPAFYLQLLDSVHQVNTGEIPEGRPVILMFFSPDCEHCRAETEQLLNHMDSLREVRFILMTPMRLGVTRAWAKELGLSQYKNIIVARDYSFFFPAFFHVDHVPYLALYDRKKQFVGLYDAHMKVEDLVRIVRGL